MPGFVVSGLKPTGSVDLHLQPSNGCNTRRYHGLLVAATKPPVGRFVLLSKLEATLIIDERRYELGTNRYPGVIHPVGFEYLKQMLSRCGAFP